MSLKYYPFIAVFFLVLLVGLLVTSELGDNKSKGNDIDWKLPSRNFSPPNAKQLSEFSQLSLWQEKLAPTATMELLGWALKGIIYDQNSPYILVLKEGEHKLTKLTLGSQLPNGEVIDKITDNYVVYQYQNETKTIHLHQQYSIDKEQK